MNVRYSMWGSIVDWPPMGRAGPTSLIVRMKRLQSYDRRLLGKIIYEYGAYTSYDQNGG